MSQSTSKKKTPTFVRRLKKHERKLRTTGGSTKKSLTGLDFPRRNEHQEQAEVFSWAELNSTKWPELTLLYAIPNVGTKNPLRGKRMKEEGLKKGVPDWCLPVPRGKYHGLYVEQKALDGTLKQEQEDWLCWLWGQGYYTAVSFCAEESKQILEWYMNLGEFSYDTR